MLRAPNSNCNVASSMPTLRIARHCYLGKGTIVLSDIIPTSVGAAQRIRVQVGHLSVDYSRFLNWAMHRCDLGKYTLRLYSHNRGQQSTRRGGPVGWSETELFLEIEKSVVLTSKLVLAGCHLKGASNPSKYVLGGQNYLKMP